MVTVNLSQLEVAHNRIAELEARLTTAEGLLRELRVHLREGSIERLRIDAALKRSE